MIKKLLAAVLVWGCGFGNTVFAQKENYVWYFGNHAGVDFNSGTPVALTNGQLNTIEGSSSISDANGNLLFYTDGITVWDRNHNVMPTGTGLGGGASSTQSALILPFPGNNLMYYIFTVGNWWTVPDFNYSVVDMTLNSGNGDVTVKNQLLISPVTERLTAVRHSNNTDIWVMVQEISSVNLYAYLVTAAGVTTTPIISAVGANLNFGLDCQGQMKFTSVGTKIAYVTSEANYVDLFDFDISTGVASNKKHLPIPSFFSRSYGLEFSQSGDFLYATRSSNPETLFQWDITSNSEPIINASLDSIGTTLSQEMDALQMGPDGKIYVAKGNATHLGIINDPELPGLLSNYVDSGVYLGGMLSYAGLPNFITSYFLSTGISNLQFSNSNFQLYPNPATDKIYISFPATTSENITLKIYSVRGENLFQSSKTLEKVNATTIDVTGLSNGIYFLSVQTGREVVTKKVVVNH